MPLGRAAHLRRVRQALAQLATEWEYNEDQSAATLTLREGVKFSDGSDFDAEDVEATLTAVGEVNDRFADLDVRRRRPAQRSRSRCRSRSRRSTSSCARRTSRPRRRYEVDKLDSDRRRFRSVHLRRRRQHAGIVLHADEEPGLLGLGDLPLREARAEGLHRHHRRPQRTQDRTDRRHPRRRIHRRRGGELRQGGRHAARRHHSSADHRPQRREDPGARRCPGASGDEHGLRPRRDRRGPLPRVRRPGVPDLPRRAAPRISRTSPRTRTPTTSKPPRR